MVVENPREGKEDLSILAKQIKHAAGVRDLRRKHSSGAILNQENSQKEQVNEEAIKRANERKLRRQASSSLGTIKEKASRKVDVNKEAVNKANDRQIRRQGSHLAAVKEKAHEKNEVNKQVVKTATKMKERKARTTDFASKLKNEVRAKADSLEKGRKSRRRLSLELSTKFGHDSLSNIDSQKSSIAVLRPARRKIKWDNRLADQSRMQQSSSRLDTLNMEDLDLPGMKATGDADSESDDTEGMTIAELEKAIGKTFRALKRLRKEAKLEKEAVESLQKQNQEMRRTLVEGAELSMTPRPSAKSVMDDLEDVLQRNVSMDREIEALIQERLAIEEKLKAFQLHAESGVTRSPEVEIINESTDTNYEEAANHEEIANHGSYNDSDGGLPFLKINPVSPVKKAMMKVDSGLLAQSQTTLEIGI